MTKITRTIELENPASAHVSSPSGETTKFPFPTGSRHSRPIRFGRHPKVSRAFLERRVAPIPDVTQELTETSVDGDR